MTDSDYMHSVAYLAHSWRPETDQWLIYIFFQFFTCHIAAASESRLRSQEKFSCFGLPPCGLTSFGSNEGLFGLTPRTRKVINKIS